MMKTYLFKKRDSSFSRKNYFNQRKGSTSRVTEEKSETFFKPATLIARSLNTVANIETFDPIINTDLSGFTKSTKSCSVKKARFTKVPDGKLPCHFEKIKDGTKIGKFYGASFDIEAQFESNPPCITCVNGEYRQEIKGYFKRNGIKEDVDLCGNLLEEDNYNEDCARVGGIDYKPGYHSQKLPASYFENPNQKMGCTFKMSDTPGMYGKKGDEVELNLSFIGKLIDTTNKEVLDKASWDVEGKHKIK